MRFAQIFSIAPADLPRQTWMIRLVPTEYFNDLLTLRCELLNSGFDDEMFENLSITFIEVFW